MTHKLNYIIASTANSICLPLLILTITILIVTVPAHAQNNNDSEYILSESTYNSLTKINKLLEEGNYNEALDKLLSLRRKISEDAYEEAVVQQTMGYAYNGMQRYEEAAIAFMKAVDSGSLPKDVNHRLNYFIAQLLAQTKDYSQAIDYLEKWFATEPDPNQDAYRLAAGLYYEVKNYDQVTKYAQEAIRVAQKPDESLYQLLLASYLETKNYSDAADLLERMLQLFPDNKSYWKQLYSVYQLLSNEKKSLAVYELAYRRGLLDREEKEELARLYLHLQTPYRAAHFLETELENGGLNKSAKNLRLLAQSYFLARETDKAIAAYEQAAEATGDGELYFRLGQLLVSEQRWEAAQQALQNALNDDTLTHAAHAHLLLGISAYKLNNGRLAAEALQQASQDKNTKERAEYWLKQIKKKADISHN